MKPSKRYEVGFRTRDGDVCAHMVNTDSCGRALRHAIEVEMTPPGAKTWEEAVLAIAWVRWWPASEPDPGEPPDDV
jgi:hypothetical protein